ncbi:hypothetical protein [Rubellicoccus peritrichatus]|uniref:YcaO domain-containing protein n=1 Tax=Rubellicoccus peritrichatus TaxID=3080537 RepID=A0AAQ3L5G3_9BACT|nr:hypothetical protein [Puniceicoccus sp. CR14]WOO39530.1 hypothetical protein RZN69_12975 [Puniceicoccus sp. CR14]
MNLAPFKFRNALAEDGGPISRIEEGHEVIFGRHQYCAMAYLREDLVSRGNQGVSVPVPDGAGSGNDLQTARYRAISEAVERWALRDCLQSPEARKDYGFDYDRCSNGMAAYPGLFNTPARNAAMREAIERHCLIQWWEGNLGSHHIACPIQELKAIRIENPFSKDVVVLLLQFRKESYFVYGFGIGPTEDDACWRAAIELHRTGAIVDKHYEDRDSISHAYIESHEHLYERRSLFFSHPDGFELVLKRMRKNAPAHRPKPLKMLVDREIAGPWSQYATVWRIVLEQPSMDYLGPRSDVFFW